jgi:flagellar biosynthesis protein FlhG
MSNNTKTQKRTSAPRVIAVSSGKGGVGKTLTTVHLATAASRLGKRVLVLDGDMGMANVDVVLGLHARYNINDVLENNIPLRDIILEGPLGIRIIPSGSGIAKLANLGYVQRAKLVEHIEALNEEFDLLLIDTGAGISETVQHLNHVADQVVVVTTPEPHAMTDAYALIKVLQQNNEELNVSLLVNMVHSDEEGLKVSARLAEVGQRFLGMEIGYLGCIPVDPQVQKSVARRQVATESATHTISGQAWNKVTRGLLDCSHHLGKRQEMDIWRELIWSQQSQIGARV